MKDNKYRNWWNGLTDRVRKTLVIVAVVLCIIALGAVMSKCSPGVKDANAATPNYSLSTPGIVPMTFFMDGQYTTTQAGIIRFNMPFRARMIGTQVSCDTIGGSASPTNSVDVNDDGTTILTGDMAVTAADTVVEGTLVSSPVIADESVMTVDFTITGTSPTFDDCTLVLLLQRQ